MAPRRRRAALVACAALLGSTEAFAVSRRGHASQRTTTHAATVDYDLADKRVLVTGASGGIGAAIAVRAWETEAGH
jgi:NADPH:quinone reductase-like Zn-dependent oxidoreductase